ncbi:MAG: SiaB family protein kinase [Sulfuricurvum sp.]|jgi:hypothetical protein|uniref:SiaB family protein kinase n=1 Tax=Sulfuricurvum sp. TaxID=2025608 RepID=UPI0025EFF036|nr:SiaB family protein kinase [Sulfuricurvum sp.]MCK9371925.1 SiaB family protein kinase [Sulfuricurvum sp.]
MTLNEFRNLKTLFDGYKLIFCYNGYLSQDIIVSISSMIKEKLTAENTKMGVSQKVLYMFVEQAQNITRYSADQLSQTNDTNLSYGSIVIGTENEKFYIMCSNRIEKSKVPALHEKLTELSSMSQEDLKMLYKEKIRSESDQGSKGASIGFIEMARKSSEPFEFDFIHDDDTYDCFALKVII